MDKISSKQRSANMKAIRSVGTTPEIILRQLVFRMGYRYRLHVAHLPGKPDLVFKKRRKVIFVHGCFWHQHNCVDGRLPKSNESYWIPKLTRNIERDRENIVNLTHDGWSVLVVWECELLHLDQLSSRLANFLGPIATDPKEPAKEIRRHKK